MYKSELKKAIDELKQSLANFHGHLNTFNGSFTSYPLLESVTIAGLVSKACDSLSEMKAEIENARVSIESRATLEMLKAGFYEMETEIGIISGAPRSYPKVVDFSRFHAYLVRKGHATTETESYKLAQQIRFMRKLMTEALTSGEDETPPGVEAYTKSSLSIK